MIDEARMIRVRSTARDGVVLVRAAIEDRFHHFRIMATLDAMHVRSATVEPLRFPYTLCPAAGARVGMLAGAARSGRMSDYAALLDARHQCTHQFDVAALALALAARGVEDRQYAIRVRLNGETSHGTVHRDGLEVLAMQVEGDQIVAPQEFGGRVLGSGFTGWTSAALDEAAAEEALLLRRMIFIARDSRHADDYELAYSAPAFKGCWVQQPERNDMAIRLKGRLLAPDHDRTQLTADDDAFLEEVAVASGGHAAST